MPPGLLARAPGGNSLAQVRTDKKMSIDTETRHITPAGGNVFADLGFGPEEAAALKAESDRLISQNFPSRNP